MGKIICLTNYNQYESKRCFTESLAKELRSLGHQVAVFDADKTKSLGALVALAEENPDLVLTFHALLPLPSGHQVWEVVPSSFFCILLDPAIYSTAIIKSEECIIGTIDYDDLSVIHSIRGINNSFFFPHAVDKELFNVEHEKKEWEAVFLGSCYDYVSIEKIWKEKYEKAVVDMLYDAAELALFDNSTSLYSAFLQAAKEHKTTPNAVNYHDAFYELDIYVRGKERVQMLRAFRSIPLHVFGDVFEAFPGASNGFEYYLSDCKNIVIHPSVSYKKSFEMQRKARFTLNSSIMYKNGSHERLFTPAACRSLLVTSDGIYIRNIFSEEQVIINAPLDYKTLEQKVVAIGADPDLYSKMLESYRQTVLSDHTWEQRAKLLDQKLKGRLSAKNNV